ncbi:MAG: tRNA epoxyqueuosine(34) reductase QueG [Vicinamibacterales bacterium]|nr:tRNA epoxyqueuosine(34) reductase QueG [Vicinamibacterales bacterium]
MALSSSGIKEQAGHIGFDLCGVAPAADLPELAFFQAWLGRGYAGEMAYLNRSADERADVRRVLPSARSVIVTGTIYNTDVPYSTESADPGCAQIARYAWGDDYHDVIAARLGALLAWMREHSTQPFDARAYVDTGPVQERVYAQHGGVGWIGKNTCVINPEVGSWIFLAEIICSLPLDVDEPALDQCGTCTLCIDACPTRALVAPGVLDSTRCISYLTIEQRGPIPDEVTTSVGLHVYGCDVCQEVCPWNQMAPSSSDPAWQPRPAWTNASVSTLALLDDAELRKAMRGSSMRRTKVAGLRRNLRVALENAKRL